MRDLRRYSQTELAEAAGVTASAVCRIERGNRIPSLRVALRIADKLRAPVEMLWESLGEYSLGGRETK